MKNRSRVTMRILGGISLAASGLLLACAGPPTATEDRNAEAVSFGRTNDNGASIWLPDGSLPCAVVDGTGALVPVPCSMQVATPSSNSNALVVVRASGIFNATGKTVHWGPDNPGWQWAGLFYVMFGVTAPPYPCGVKVGPGSTFFVDILFTLDWQATVTPSGEATVTCHYSDASAWVPPGLAGAAALNSVSEAATVAQFTATDLTTGLVDPGLIEVLGKHLRMRGVIGAARITSTDPRLTGNALQTVNAELLVADGSGRVWGKLEVQADAGGDWEGSFEGQTEPTGSGQWVTTLKLVGRGRGGAIDGLLFRAEEVAYQNVFMGPHLGQVTGTILQPH